MKLKLTLPLIGLLLSGCNIAFPGQGSISSESKVESSSSTSSISNSDSFNESSNISSNISNTSNQSYYSSSSSIAKSSAISSLVYNELPEIQYEDEYEYYPVNIDFLANFDYLDEFDTTYFRLDVKITSMSTYSYLNVCDPNNCNSTAIVINGVYKNYIYPEQITNLQVGDILTIQTTAHLDYEENLMFSYPTAIYVNGVRVTGSDKQEDSSSSSSSYKSSSSSISSKSSSSSSSSSFSSQIGKYTCSLTYISTNVSTNYTSGNNGTFTTSSHRFEYVYAYGTTSAVATLYKGYTAKTSMYKEGGCLANVDGFDDISSIQIKYRSNSSFKIYTGENNYLGDTYTIAASSSETTYTINTTNLPDFFKIVAGTADLKITSIDIKYNSYTSKEITYANYDEVRINPITSNSNSLTAGSSTYTMPTKITRNGNKYTITESKTYTYYTIDYINSHPSSASYAALTNPVDVINYYLAFNEAPCNYQPKDNISQAQDLFDDDARVLQSFNRTDGYVNAVPFISGSTYCELDIDLNGNYSPYNRGVGRIVIFTSGFSSSGSYSDYYNKTLKATSYDSHPVALYTDDHYYSFREYLNTGSFSTPFKGSCLVSNSYMWTCPTTLTK